MKKLLTIISVIAILFANSVAAQEKKEDKSKRPSPPAKVTQTIASGATITIDYSQPSVKGRTIGKDLEPKEGAVWRTGANEATIFETSKDLTIGSQKLPAGKYSLFTLSGAGEWTIIFNKTWNQWGAYDYKQADDVLRVKATATQSTTASEKLNFNVDKTGAITLLWGNNVVSFNVK